MVANGFHRSFVSFEQDFLAFLIVMLTVIQENDFHDFSRFISNKALWCHD